MFSRTRARRTTVSTRGAEDEAVRPPRPWRKAPPRHQEHPTLRVLFIDADSVGAEQMAATLRPTYAVTVAPTAQAARTAIANHVPDLIITEVDLADANGLHLVEQWRRAPDTRDTLYIILTGRGSVPDKIAGFQAGADDYLIKPVAPDEFLIHVRAVSRFRRLIHGPLTGKSL
ncbi:MAG TPA: response regulator [Ktedonobacterales bacterium]|nr:response regulator [Ktedonobacterales bacterium]